MPWGLARFHHSGQSHFVTFCCYHRRRLFTTDASRRIFQSALERAAQLPASRLPIRCHARPCSPPAQRTATGYPGRCVEVEAPSGRLSPLRKSRAKSRDLEARSIVAFACRSPTQAKGRLEWGTPALFFQSSRHPLFTISRRILRE